MSTITRVEHETKKGQWFLRRVIRENATGGWNDSWTGHASPDTDWGLEFRRTIEGKIGDPDQTVATDIDLTPKGKYGPVSDWGSADGEPVIDIPRPARIYLSSSTLTLTASMLLDGWRISINCHRGSPASKQHGLGWVQLEAYKMLKIGGSTFHRHHQHTTPSASVIVDAAISVNGRKVCNGPVN